MGTKRMTHNLDLRGLKCPMNFVKTRLYMDKMQSGEILAVLLDAGEAVESVGESIAQEGHEVLGKTKEPGGHFRLSIRKV